MKCEGKRVVRQLAERAEQGVLWWFGYGERMEEEHLVKKITRSDVRDVKPRRGPHTVLGITPWCCDLSLPNLPPFAAW